jgi:organic hydroperoxide reductase OsmC/OhrA
MQEYPHVYRATAESDEDVVVGVSSPGLPPLRTTPPPEFGGPEGTWSPETLLVASVADCFILTFKSIARASRLDWTHLSCEAKGILERVERVTRFTRFELYARLEVPAHVDEAKADRILHHSEGVCLITASLNSEIVLHTDIVSG